MKKIFLTVGLGLYFSTVAVAQNIYYTKDGQISFFSSTPVENIQADNNKVTSIMNIETGDIEFSALIMAFQFEKALMQEHFNENYMESSKFPKAVFKGTIVNLNDIDFKTNGKFPAVVKGEITIHGVSRKLTANGFFYVDDGNIKASSEFTVSPSDFDIEIPALVRNNIANEIKVTVANNYILFTKQ